MKSWKQTARLMLLGCCLAISAWWAWPEPARAEHPDAAMFHEELAQHGTWREDRKFGPVWHPRGVKRNWRPYTDGRWVPAKQGYIFETQEPWGWATYHYGNWMPHQQHGWVWVPGRTWYPHTCAWRESNDYVGWAPIPPPGYLDDGGMGGSMLNMLEPSMWLFVQAAQFLLGFGQPYDSGYSYYNSGYLAPVASAPVIYRQTTIINNIVYPSYAPRASYVWGPPVDYVCRVTRIHRDHLHRHLERVHLAKVRNAVAPEEIYRRRPYLREVTPVLGAHNPTVHQMRGGHDLRQLNRPDVAARPATAPRAAAGQRPPEGVASRWTTPGREQGRPASDGQWRSSQPGGQPPTPGVAGAAPENRRERPRIQEQADRQHETGMRWSRTAPAASVADGKGRPRPATGSSTRPPSPAGAPAAAQVPEPHQRPAEMTRERPRPLEQQPQTRPPRERQQQRQLEQVRQQQAHQQLEQARQQQMQQQREQTRQQQMQQQREQARQQQMHMQRQMEQVRQQQSQQMRPRPVQAAAAPAPAASRPQPPPENPREAPPAGQQPQRAHRQAGAAPGQGNR